MRHVDLLQIIRKIADYQFGKGAGDKLFPDKVSLTLSKRTGRVKQIRREGELIATLNPTSGLFSLTIEGAKMLAIGDGARQRWVKVQDEAARFIEDGSDVFAKHLVDVDEKIRPMEEVVVFNSNNEIIAVGKAVLSGIEMRDFSRGVAVRVRRGRLEKAKKGERYKIDSEGVSFCGG